MRNALLAWSPDAGKTWSSPARVNSGVEAVQGEENGPKVAFADHKAYVVWSIPGEKGDKTRAISASRWMMEMAASQLRKP
jgi:hypothetical protein